MGDRRGLTLLEVLLAVVLLAVVVGVCAPYLRPPKERSDPAALSVFAASVAEAVHQRQRGEAELLTAEQFGEIAAANGWRFGSVGDWVIIRGGEHSVVRWARPVESEEER